MVLDHYSVAFSPVRAEVSLQTEPAWQFSPLAKTFESNYYTALSNVQYMLNKILRPYAEFKVFDDQIEQMHHFGRIERFCRSMADSNVTGAYSWAFLQ